MYESYTSGSCSVLNFTQSVGVLCVCVLRTVLDPGTVSERVGGKSEQERKTPINVVYTYTQSTDVDASTVHAGNPTP